MTVAIFGAAASGTSMVPDLAVFLIAGSVAITMYALHAGRHTKRATKPVKKLPTAATPTAPSEMSGSSPERSVRREIEEFDLSFFSDT